MKRRNGECGKLRRPIKRNKITDGIYGSTVLYLKFFFLWALVLLADFILEFRFEFLWPFWLLLRSVYDSYKYQGLAFSVFFVSIALTSDMICYFFIPVQWLFFAASTYVWVQYVWHTEKGICLPTVILWLLFAYTEAAIRLKDLRHMPFHLDLCRPFAAHCIGYPVVTLGFGFKSYVTYRIRQRKQKDVTKINSFYMSLLSDALPIEAVQSQQQCQAQITSIEKSKVEVHSNGVNQNGGGGVGCHVTSQVKASSCPRKSLDKAEPVANGNTPHLHHLDLTAIKHGSNLELEEIECEKERKSKSKAASGQKESFTNNRRARQAKEPPPPSEAPFKDEYCIKLETDVKRLRSELASSRQGEQDLRCQVNSLAASEKQARSELAALVHHNEELQSRIQSLTGQRQSDKQASDRKFSEERKLRSSLEQQLTAERKAKQRAEEAASRATAAAASAAAAAMKPECTEMCRSRRRELECEVKQLRRELKAREERCANTDRELQTMIQYKESHNEAEMLMAALSALRDKTTHLEDSLSAETRIKLDLFSALGEAKRQIEIQESVIRQQDKEVAELKGKMAQVFAVMPAEFVAAAGGVVTAGSQVTSPLDPNASVYTPKAQPPSHLTTEA